MGAIEDYERVLKDAVSAKRLSASKIQQLTELAMKNLQNDTQLVSILYRTHKSLPAAHKIPSLYIFDALAKSARSVATKTGADTHASKGNASTFLAKMEGVLDGLILDMVNNGTTEAREKTKKVLDIWSKSSTFPVATMTRLSGLMKETEGPPVIEKVPKDRGVDYMKAPPPDNATTEIAANLPPALLALLAQASAVTNRSTDMAQSPNQLNHDLHSSPLASSSHNSVAVSPLHSLDPASLALLQQLSGGLSTTANNDSAKANQNNSSASTMLKSKHDYERSSVGPSHTTSEFMSRNQQFSAPEHQPNAGNYYPNPHNDSHFAGDHDHYNRSYDKWRSGSGSRDAHERKENYEERDRGYGRDPRGSRRESRASSWRDHNTKDDRSRSPPRRDSLRAGHSHSFSPPSTDDTQPPYSAPHRASQDPRRVTATVDPRKRPSPPKSNDMDIDGDPIPQDEEYVVHSPGPLASTSALPTLTSEPESSKPTRIRPSRWGERLPVEPAASVAYTSHRENSHAGDRTPAPDTVRSASQVVDAATSTAVGSLETFDFSSFDPTNADCWSALGSSWEVSYGRLPSQEEMMGLLMMMNGQMYGMDPSMVSNENSGNYNGGLGNEEQNTWQYQVQEKGYQNTHSGRGLSRGRGGRGRGGRGGYGRGGHFQESDRAFPYSSVGPTDIVDAVIQGTAMGAPKSNGGGHMTKVEGKWKWVG